MTKIWQSTSGEATPTPCAKGILRIRGHSTKSAIPDSSGEQTSPTKCAYGPGAGVFQKGGIRCYFEKKGQASQEKEVSNVCSPD